jgi:hypothetical protein
LSKKSVTSSSQKSKVKKGNGKEGKKNNIADILADYDKKS